MLELVIVLVLMVAVALLLTLYPRRSDLIALIPVLVLATSGILTPQEAFGGFVSSAVVVLISAFILARGIFSTGLLDRLAEWIFKRTHTPKASLTGILLMVAAVSAFFSDTGTLLLMLPVVHRLCRRFNLAPSRVMMPLAFATLTTGTVTLTAASSNLVIANSVAEAGLGELGFLTLAPLGVAVSAAGMAFILLVAPRFLPERATRAQGQREFETADYLTEVRVSQGSPLAGERALGVQIGPGMPPVGAIRRGKSLFSPTERLALREGDRLLLRVDPKNLKEITLADGLELAQADSTAVDLLEVVVPPNSTVVGRSTADLGLEVSGASLVGISRKGLSPGEELSSIKLQIGDVLLIRGSDAALRKSLQGLGCLPLEDRGVVVFNRNNTLKAAATFGLVLGLAVSQATSVAVAFALGAFLIVLLGAVSLREAYASIDWPLAALIGGLLSLGAAMEKTGAAALMADWILGTFGGLGPIASVAFLLLLALLMTTFINNAAVAAIMAPVAVFLSRAQGSNPLTLLAAVAVGCSLSFLLPYSHQCNLLVQGPGGYEARDYLKVGGLMLLFVVPVALAVILLVWPP